MKLGLFMMPLHPPEKDRTQCFEEDIELAILADNLGFSEAWIRQHNTAGLGDCPRPVRLICDLRSKTGMW